MARREEEASAISLFSFQDIITSITGIMFLVVLLLVLIMLTSHEPSKQEVKTEDADTQEMLAQLATLQQQLAELKNIQNIVDKDLEKIRTLSPAAIEAKLKELEKLLKQKSLELQKSALEQKKAQAELEELERKLRDLNQQLDPKLKKLKKLEEQRKNLQHKLQQKKAEIEQRKKMMEYSIDNNTNKIPVLVEVSADGCQVLNVSNNQHSDLRVRGNAYESIKKLWQYLERNCDPSINYVTLVVKPSGFQHVAGMTESLKQKKFERGIEILPDEKTSIFEVK